MSVASSLISYFNNEDFDTILYKDFVQDNLDAAWYRYIAFGKLLDSIQPDMVYAFNGRHAPIAPILMACKEKKVPFFTHECAGVNNRYRVVAQALPQDEGPVIDECQKLYELYGDILARQAAHSFYSRRKNGNPGGGIIFTQQQEAGILPENFDPKKKNVVFYNSSTFEFAALPGVNSLSSFYSTEEDALLQVAKSAEQDHNIQIYCRVHPHLADKDTSQVKNLLALTESLPNLTIIPPQSPVDTYALMEHSSIVVTFHSTVGAEASFWGKPVIVLGHAVYRRLGGVYLPHSHEEFMALLRSDLPPLPPIGAIKYGLWQEKGGRLYENYCSSPIYGRGTFKGVDIYKVAERALLPRKIGRHLLALTGLCGWKAARHTFTQVIHKLSGFLCI